MEENLTVQKVKLVNTVVTSRTTHLELPDKLSKQDLIRNFKSKGYLLPTNVSNKTLYTAALALKNKVPVYIPLSKEIVAHDYIIKANGYELRPEVERVMKYANLPGDAVRSITEEAVYSLKGVPLWCEGSKVDLHYYLVVLQYINPKIYASIKGSTEVVQHVLLLDGDANSYYKIQKKVGKQLERIRCDAVKLRGIKNSASDLMKSLFEATSFFQSQVTNFVQVNGGLSAINPNVELVLKRVCEKMVQATAAEQLVDARGYYKQYLNVNRGSFKQIGLKIPIDSDCPPPLQEPELPIESFDQVADQMMSYVEQGFLQQSTVQDITSGMPTYGYLIYPEDKDTLSAKKPPGSELVERARRYIKNKTPIPLTVLKIMLDKGIWKFDPTTRCFIPTEDWEDAPTIPPAICFNFAASEEGSKIIKKSLDEGTIRTLNPSEFFKKKSAIDPAFLDDYTDNPILEEITADIIKDASIKKEKSKLVNTADRLVEAVVKSAVESLESNPEAIKDILESRRKSLCAAFPPIHRIQATISEKLVPMVDEMLRQDATLREGLRRRDPENTILLKIVEKTQSVVGKLSVAPCFLDEIKNHAETSLITLESKLDLSSSELKLTYKKAIMCVERMLKANARNDPQDFLNKYDQLASLSLTDTYEPAAQSINSAQTAGGQTAGFTEQIKGFEAALTAGTNLEPFAIALQKKNITELFRAVRLLDKSKAVVAIYRNTEALWEFFEDSNEDMVTALQPISLALVLFSRYLIFVCIEAAAQIVEQNKVAGSSCNGCDICRNALLIIFRIACLFKFREKEKNPEDFDCGKDLTNAIDHLTAHHILEYKSSKKASREIKFRATTCMTDYYFATSAISWLAFRGNSQYNTESLDKRIENKSQHARPAKVTSADKKKQLEIFIRNAFEWYVKNDELSKWISSFDLEGYFASPECIVPQGYSSKIESHIVMAKEPGHAGIDRALTLVSMFVSVQEFDLVRALLHEILLASSFQETAASIWPGIDNKI